MQLYISQSDSRVGFSDNRITVKTSDGVENTFPAETVAGVTVFGLPSMSTKFLRELLRREIDLQMFSSDGHYVGKLSSPINGNAKRQKQQAYLSDDPKFSLDIAQKLIFSKVRHQIDLLRAYNHDDVDIHEFLFQLQNMSQRIFSATSLNALNGVEGSCARVYFRALSLLVPQDFYFSGRSKRPPKDPFNALLSLGYSMLYKSVVGGIERNGLNPFYGFMHQDYLNHAALASDIMEEWRSLIVDDTVMQLVWEGDIAVDMFSKNSETGGVYVSREGIKALVSALGDKISRSAKYLNHDNYNYSFQYALDLQLQKLVRAIETKDSSAFTSLVQN